MGNHDQKRIASRFDAEFIDAINMMTLLLPGTAITYNGDELGMEDSYIRWDQTVDPQALNVGAKRYEHFSRDFARSPFQWDASPNAGECALCTISRCVYPLLFKKLLFSDIRSRIKQGWVKAHIRQHSTYNISNWKSTENWTGNFVSFLRLFSVFFLNHNLCRYH